MYILIDCPSDVSQAISSKSIDIETAVSFPKSFRKDSDLDQLMPEETNARTQGPV